MCRFVTPLLLLLLPGCSPGPVSEEDSLEGEQLAARQLLIFQHCVVSATVTSTPSGGPPALRPPAQPPRCFPTFSAAIASATGGRVRLPVGASPLDVDEAMLESPGGAGPGWRPHASHVIAVEFMYRRHGGSTLTVESPAACDTATLTLSLPPGWNDVIASARTFGSCTHAYHYENSSFGGARVDCGRACAELGEPLEHGISSIQWTR